jgi:ketosteroid isomerase-like protein
MPAPEQNGRVTPSDMEKRARTLQLVRTYVDTLKDSRIDEWGGLWAEDAVCEFPFARDVERRIYTGKDAIVAYTRAIMGRIRVDRIERLRVMPLEDPEGVVIEAVIEARILPEGNPYHQTYVAVCETKDGKILHYREYFNPLVSEEALSGGRTTASGTIGLAGDEQ